MEVFGHLLYILSLIVGVLIWNQTQFSEGSVSFVLVIGTIGLWRYGWSAIHWIRFLIYTHYAFPKLRQKAQQLGDWGRPSHLYLMVTSFRIDAETTRKVYTSVFKEAIVYGNDTTIVASIVERADQFLIKNLFLSLNPPPNVRLIFTRVAGTGKRDALACGFRAISKTAVPIGSLVAVIDGDSMLDVGLLEKCCPMFKVDPKAGALTTDEVCDVEGAWVFKEWYSLRFAQRHVLMGSVGLSRRVLTLTGRMSMFRAEIVCDPDFIEQVELDWIDHWRLGRIRFLTGDDKSSWFHLLKNGFHMLYIPDAVVRTIETPPNPSFFISSVALMRRWFGNMLRTNARALALTPKPMGMFTWWCILDQRMSMWTSLTGLTAAVIGAVAISPYILFYYVIWIAFTRYILTLSLLASRGSVSIFYPFMLYYNQIVGSFIKVIVLFRLDKQKWTRQNTTFKKTGTDRAERLRSLSTLYVQTFSLILFGTLIATIIGAIRMPDIELWSFYLIRIFS